MRGEQHDAAAGDLIIEGVLADGVWAAVNGCNRMSAGAGRLRAAGFLLLSSWHRLYCLGIFFRGLLLGNETESMRSENMKVTRV